MNPRKKHNKKRAARRRAVERSSTPDTRGWKGMDPEVRDAKKKVQKLFKSLRNGNGNGNGK